MCIHTTHLLFTCGHHLDLPTTGKNHVPPIYCDRVKSELDWYHTQPDRKPEPIPYPPPRPCPLVWGSQPFSGNTQVVAQKHPCAVCVALHGLAGINAIEAQIAKQEPQPPKRKKKGSKGKKVDKKWIWVSVKGDGWTGLQKVPANASSARKPADATLTRAEISTVTDYEARLSPYQVTLDPYSSPSEAAATLPAAIRPYYEPQSAAESFALMQEAGRRGMDMYMNYPDSRLQMPQGTVTEANILGAVPAYAIQPVPVPYQGEIQLWAYQGHNPEIFNPAFQADGSQQTGPNFLPDGTVELPDEAEMYGEAAAQHTVGATTPSDQSDTYDDTLINRKQSPRQHIQQSIVPQGQTRESGNPQEEHRRCSIESKDGVVRSTSPLVLHPRPHSSMQ
ncbi:MAG: hypothetical protein LQ340_004579 [Diploschistes diacapsis]|nr:MAG: hypothetical protein LQ340_004579 [Diploschistes diacapsis]